MDAITFLEGIGLTIIESPRQGKILIYGLEKFIPILQEQALAYAMENKAAILEELQRRKEQRRLEAIACTQHMSAHCQAANVLQ